MSVLRLYFKEYSPYGEIPTSTPGLNLSIGVKYRIKKGSTKQDLNFTPCLRFNQNFSATIITFIEYPEYVSNFEATKTHFLCLYFGNV